jgi:hypothetical protein
MILLLFFCVFVTWIGTETVPTFVEDAKVADEEQDEE